MSENQPVKIKPNMTTVCVGRFTIDVPEGSGIRFRSARFSGVDIVVRSPYTALQLQGDIDKREKVLSGKRNEYDLPSLEIKSNENAINFPATTLYFDRTKPTTMIEFGKAVPGNEEGISVEGYGMKDDVAYVFRAVDLASPRSEKNLSNLIKRFEARPITSMPEKPGFCLDGGFVHEPIRAEENEAVAMFASMEGHPDVAIRIDFSINMKRIEESLLSRDGKNDLKQEYASRFKSFGRRQRMLNGIPGEEMLDKVEDFNGTSAHAFMWEAPGKIKNVLFPNIILELQTGIGKPGEPVNSSLSDEEVLELWQSITSSLRIRKTSVGSDKQLEGDPSDIKLGELAATGQPCPQTGTWECKEKENVERGPRRFFREGSKMPPCPAVVGQHYFESESAADPAES